LNSIAAQKKNIFSTALPRINFCEGQWKLENARLVYIRLTDIKTIYFLKSSEWLPVLSKISVLSVS